MKKEDFLKNIRLAKKSHILWVERAKKLVNGLPIGEDEIPLEPTSCAFGQWFYGDGQVMLAIFSQASIKKLEDKHKELHTSYLKIFKIYFDLSTQGFFSKLLKRPKKISDIDRRIAMDELDNLEKISEEMVSYLNIIDARINQVEAEDLEKYL